MSEGCNAANSRSLSRQRWTVAVEVISELINQRRTLPDGGAVSSYRIKRLYRNIYQRQTTIKGVECLTNSTPLQIVESTRIISKRFFTFAPIAGNRSEQERMPNSEADKGLNPGHHQGDKGRERTSRFISCIMSHQPIPKTAAAWAIRL